ncbi:uncharacterized protein MONBRDRAFT_10855 [Monosiga brevicollis MX1]|uniref:Uncharacterized protein n=1 Tax=Monosiga brevicollis TaxID=81824 RepID=A9V7F6_MONBE|nr:uncharacterized protein MONBRDRAFT_10855 [Monosiga brevicollis MX1]EDQ86577.1 predicted protein [Monosiga brevicollis MX1]|eukprot:XP_001748690.1 hypothetical protein [Monosiga brevicollis MX1]
MYTFPTRYHLIIHGVLTSLTDGVRRTAIPTTRAQPVGRVVRLCFILLQVTYLARVFGWVFSTDDSTSCTDITGPLVFDVFKRMSQCGRRGAEGVVHQYLDQCVTSDNGDSLAAVMGQETASNQVNVTGHTTRVFDLESLLQTGAPSRQTHTIEVTPPLSATLIMNMGTCVLDPEVPLELSVAIDATTAVNITARGRQERTMEDVEGFKECTEEQEALNRIYMQEQYIHNRLDAYVSGTAFDRIPLDAAAAVGILQRRSAAGVWSEFPSMDDLRNLLIASASHALGVPENRLQALDTEVIAALIIDPEALRLGIDEGVQAHRRSVPGEPPDLPADLV